MHIVIFLRAEQASLVDQFDPLSGVYGVVKPHRPENELHALRHVIDRKLNDTLGVGRILILLDGAVDHQRGGQCRRKFAHSVREGVIISEERARLVAAGLG